MRISCHKRLPISATLVIAVCIVALPFVIVFASIREKKAEAVFNETTTLICREYLALKADPLNHFASQGTGNPVVKNLVIESLRSVLQTEPKLAQTIRRQQIADFGFEKRITRGVKSRCNTDADFSGKFFQAVEAVTSATVMP